MITCSWYSSYTFLPSCVYAEYRRVLTAHKNAPKRVCSVPLRSSLGQVLAGVAVHAKSTDGEGSRARLVVRMGEAGFYAANLAQVKSKHILLDVIPDNEELALSLNGKKKHIEDADFAAAFKTCGVPERIKKKCNVLSCPRTSRPLTLTFCTGE